MVDPLPNHVPEVAPRQETAAQAPLATAEGGPVVFPRRVGSVDSVQTVISKANSMLPQSENGDGIRGRKLAHFELIAPIGVGGMAAVIRARDTQLDRIVALKILPPELAE